MVALSSELFNDYILHSNSNAFCQIDKHISFNKARHSLAVGALQKGMRIKYVSKLMGQSSVKQTEV